MPDPKIVSRDEWLVARKELLTHEKELTHQRDAVNEERRNLPMVEIDKEYVFVGPDGNASLLDVFDGRRQLIVHHFMFEPDWDEGCPTCSFSADHIAFQLGHLHARDTTLAYISRAPIEKLTAYKARMGWTAPWYSSSESDFNYDFQVTLDPSVAPVEYNYEVHPGLPPGVENSLEGFGVSRVPARGRPRLQHVFDVRARRRHPHGHLQLARPHRTRAPRRLGTAARSQRRASPELAPSPRRVRQLTVARPTIGIGSGGHPILSLAGLAPDFFEKESGTGYWPNRKFRIAAC